MEIDKVYDEKVKITALLVVSLGSFLIPFMGSSLNIVLPIIQKELSVNLILLSWIPTVFVLANAATILPLGRLGDIVGRKKVFTIGMIIYTVASLMAGFSSSGIFLVIFSFIQGIGCAMIFASALALLSSVYPSNQRGGALGIYITAVYIGLFLGPLLGGFLAGNFGWRSIFFFNVPLGLLIILLIMLRLPGEWKGYDGEKFEISGSLIYALSLVAILYGVSTFQDTVGRIILVAGIFGLGLFVLKERRSDNPILRLNIFRKRVSSLSALAILIMNISTTSMWALLSLYFQDIQLIGPQETALILSVQPLMVALLSTPVGRLSDRMGKRIFSVIGMLFATTGLIILSTLNSSNGLYTPVAGLILVGVGLGFFNSPTTNKFMGSIEGKDYGMAGATLSTMIYVGQTLSLSLMLYIFSIFIGNVQITVSNFSLFLLSLKTSFTVFAIISGIGILVTLFIGKNRIKDKLRI
jgi:MFS family permease